MGLTRKLSLALLLSLTKFTFYFLQKGRYGVFHTGRENLGTQGLDEWKERSKVGLQGRFRCTRKIILCSVYIQYYFRDELISHFFI
jgi:hypothetical protein